jgi:hypothetical protein
MVAAEGFTCFAERPRRLSLLLDAYWYAGTIHAVLEAVLARFSDHARTSASWLLRQATPCSPAWWPTASSTASTGPRLG